MKHLFAILALVCTVAAASAQTNITLSNPVAQEVLFGNYDPAGYTPAVIIHDPDSILQGIVNRVCPDTLQSWLQKIDSYYNRNTGSDTVSQVHGIGAVRRWIFSKLQEFSAEHENRLLVTYMDFDLSICGMGHHRNVFGILPGLDTTQKDIVIVEGHFDTRCQGECDTACYSPGMEDNGSGTVLVMELARVMSRYAYDHTIIFACVTGEDQGLYGAKAFSTWMKTNNLPIRSVFNNDVIGGIICGMTSSPPSCPGYGNIDSTHVRIFSYSQLNDSSANSSHKQLARYVRLHQVERINPLLDTPMEINIIISEDRQGRSGDHIPFRQKGYTAIRFCAQNENGDGSGTPPDRQHTSDDILGLDQTVPPDGVLDTFFVDMNYLRRNTIMNGVNMGFLAIAPPRPEPVFTPTEGGVQVTMTGPDAAWLHYRVGVRSKGSGTLYFDSVYTFTGTTSFEITGLDPDVEHYYSVANVDNGVEGLFSPEFTTFAVGIRGAVEKEWGVSLGQNQPNPFNTETTFMIINPGGRYYPGSQVIIRDMAGRVVATLPVDIRDRDTRVVFRNPGSLKGMYLYSLRIDGTDAFTGKMIIL